MASFADSVIKDQK